jgi:hypothetical protein
MWEVGFISCNAFSQIEKDDDIVETILVNKVGYTKFLKPTWDAYNWNSKFTNIKKEKEMQAMCKYHELEMIHG